MGPHREERMNSIFQACLVQQEGYERGGASPPAALFERRPQDFVIAPLEAPLQTPVPEHKLI